jgi:hypothetical protein
MVRTVAFLAILAAGCGGVEPPGGGDKPAGKKDEPARQEPKADVEGVQDVLGMWDVCATDAVRWRDDFAGRRVVILLRPPWEVKEDGGRFYTLQEYQNGTRRTAARIYLRDDSARHLSRIVRGEEKVPAWHVLRVEALIDERDFVFTDGVLSVVEKRP